MLQNDVVFEFIEHPSYIPHTFIHPIARTEVISPPHAHESGKKELQTL